MNLLLKMDLVIYFYPFSSLMLLMLIDDLLYFTLGLFVIVENRILETSLVILMNFACASECEFEHWVE